MLLYLATVQGVTLTMGHLVPSRHVAAALSGLVITATGLTSHYLIHSDDLAVWVGWIRSGTQTTNTSVSTVVFCNYRQTQGKKRELRNKI